MDTRSYVSPVLCQTPLGMGRFTRQPLPSKWSVGPGQGKPGAVPCEAPQQSRDVVRRRRSVPPPELPGHTAKKREPSHKHSAFPSPQRPPCSPHLSDLNFPLISQHFAKIHYLIPIQPPITLKVPPFHQTERKRSFYPFNILQITLQIPMSTATR